MIPGTIISLFTFPGVIVHEWAHKKLCEWFGVPVRAVKYFRIGNPAGYVFHDIPTKYKQIFWISIGPLIINSITAVSLSFVATQTIKQSFLWDFLIWIAFSIGMHSFPSDHDMKHILAASKSELKRGGTMLHYLAFPFVALVWISNKLRFFWFDLIYASFLVGLGGGLR